MNTASNAIIPEIAKKFLPEEIIFLDTETTGLDHEKDEVIELSIVDGRGNVLLSQRFDTMAVRSWPVAQMVNHISPEDVSGLAKISNCRIPIQRVFDRAKAVICFNSNFDLGFLGYLKFKCPSVIGDVQSDIMEAVGADHWISLSAATEMNHFVRKGAHNSLSDALATAVVARMMIENERESRQTVSMGISDMEAFLSFHNFGRCD